MLAGRRALVTGAADGIGRAITELFTAEGAEVLAVDINSDRLGSAFRDNPGVRPVIQDISAPEAADRLVEEARTKLGGLDILVNNAGTPGEFKSLTETSDRTWDKVMALNLGAAFKLIRAALPLLRQSRNARIINTSSVCGQMGITFLSAYCASKAGLVGLTRSVAVELGAEGITANCILPGNTVTGLTRGVFPGADTEEGKRFIARTSVIPRYGQPEDLAGAALYLASDLASYVTGQCIVVDGGLTMRIPNALD
jgi:NAD(P)-dependent dehydrogenase (short-subunit alcohol dehydrogenase family)